MNPQVDADAVLDLAERVLGRSDRLEVSTLDGAVSHGGPAHPAFRYSANRGHLHVQGTDTVAACAGLYAYLKDACGVQLTWDTPRPLQVPEAWPDAEPTTRSTPAVHRYYLNVVTTGYSAPYWDAERWLAEVDWMALHGITTPLLMVGHEAVLARAFVSAGADPLDVRQWIGSAAHLPWTMMGGTNSFGGPLPQQWFSDRIELARVIVHRMRQLGMRAVLPAFGGHVPDSLAGPDTDRTTWQGFSTALLDPHDPRFEEIARVVARTQQEVLGTDHLYSADPFIESIPPVADLDVLRAHTHAVYAGMCAADPQAVWVMQAWPFHYHRRFWTQERIAAVTGAVPTGRLLLLDLWAEHAPVARDGRGIDRTDWLWCAVHNFGARFSVHGDLHGLVRDLAGVLDDARAGAAGADHLVGTGLAMEAIENNAVFYELATDVVWGTPDLEIWISDYVRRRYRRRDARSADAARQAWAALLDTLYRPGTTRSVPSPVIARPWDAEPPFARQRTAGEFLDPDAPPSANIDAEADPRVEGDLLLIAEAAAGLLTVVSDCPVTQATDLVDVLTHLVAQRTRAVIRALPKAAREADPDRVADLGALLIGAIDDLDRLAGTQRDRLLGTWLTQAAAWGADETERATLVRDARRLLTVWARQDSGLHDYSGRHWSGLLSGFYRPRWHLWIDWLLSIARGGDPDPTMFRRAVVDLEERWANSTDLGPTEPQGDILQIGPEVLSRYRNALV